MDDIRASNPPANEALLEALTKDLTDHDFDLRYLMRTIVNSRAYQAGIQTNVWNADDKVNFSHAMPRRLSAEELMDALALAAGSRPKFPEVPPDTKAEEFPDPHVGRDGFLDVFGRPARESSLRMRAPQRHQPAAGAEPGERPNDWPMPSPIPRAAWRSWFWRVHPIARSSKICIWRALSRYPTAKEYDAAFKFFEERRKPRRMGAGSALVAGQQQGISVQQMISPTVCRTFSGLPAQEVSMLTIPGRKGCLCDGPTRRELLRVGSVGLFGLNLANFLPMAESAGRVARLEGAQGFNSAKSVILVFLQGGPSHIDIWDPKPDAPTNVRGEFKPINTNVSGIQLSETMPMLAQQMDKCTLIRSMSYTPTGLFNHTAAIYQMLTGYPPDKVSPSGQLEPPSPADFPTAGSPYLEAEAAHRAGAAVCRNAAPVAGIRASSARAGPPVSSGKRTIPIASTRTPTSPSSSTT